MKQYNQILILKTIIVLFIIIIITIFLSTFWEIIVHKFEFIAKYLYGTDADNKGKFLTVILTSIGGLGALWGLWLNNQKLNQQVRQVNEQVRQNDIVIQNTNDKRFVEAIGYLNNENEGIAIGGIYALYQLAKEDERYAPIITDIFCNYAKNTEKKETKTFQTVISILFSENNPFVSDKELVFSNLNFEGIQMYCTRFNVKFNQCIFKSVSLIGDNSIHLCNCSAHNFFVCNFKNVIFYKGRYNKVTIGNSLNSEIEITANVLADSKIMVTDITYLLIDVNNIEDVIVYTDTAEKVYLYNITKEQILSKLSFHYSSEIKNIYIDDELVINRDELNIIYDDLMRRDRIYRWMAGSYKKMTKK